MCLAHQLLELLHVQCVFSKFVCILFGSGYSYLHNRFSNILINCYFLMINTVVQFCISIHFFESVEFEAGDLDFIIS